MIVTSCEGMCHHSKLFAQNNGLCFVLTKNAAPYFDIFQFGIYEQEDYDNIIRRTSGKVIIQWCGSDVLSFARRRRSGRFKELPSFIKHYAQSIRQVNELHKYGITAKVVHRFNDKRERYKIEDLPDNFKVLIFAPLDRSDLFCYREIDQIVSRCSDIDFLILGDCTELKNYQNVERRNTVSLLTYPEEYRNILKQTSCMLRFTRNQSEGFSQMIMQMLLLGRRVISNIKQEYVIQCELEDTNSIISKLYELKSLSTPNYEASNFYHFREDINKFDFLCAE